jgi:hypothetical protein
MAPVETEYYDLVSDLLHSSMKKYELYKQWQLSVPIDVNDTDLKKAYRKAAMKVCSPLRSPCMMAHLTSGVIHSPVPPR